MPNKSAHFCNSIGCCELTDQRFCPLHQAEDKRAYNRSRPSASKQGYDGKWQAVRLSYLRQHPLCEMCDADGKVTPAVLVHHIKPLSDGGDRLNADNLMALCNEHHEEIHGKDRFKSRK